MFMFTTPVCGCWLHDSATLISIYKIVSIFLFNQKFIFKNINKKKKNNNNKNTKMKFILSIASVILLAQAINCFGKQGTVQIRASSSSWIGILMFV